MGTRLETLRYQYEDFREITRQEGFRSAIREAIYVNRALVLVERDLTKPFPKLKQDFEINLLLVGRGSSRQIDEFEFPNKVRRLKGRTYMHKGFSAYFAVIGSKVVAEQWWISASHVRDNIKHQDPIWMGLQLKENEVYAFDLYVAPEYRGTSVTNKFAVSYMSEMRKAGYSKLYGWYFTDNIPSAWFHHTFSFDKRRTVKRHRFFVLVVTDGRLFLT